MVNAQRRLWKAINAPSGEKPVQWRLLTTSRVQTLAEASELIDWYRARWAIEIFFDILKNACKIEELQLKSMHKLEVAIALYTVVGRRIKTIWQGMEQVASFAAGMKLARQMKTAPDYCVRTCGKGCGYGLGTEKKSRAAVGWSIMNA